MAARGLGKGLDALIPSGVDTKASNASQKKRYLIVRMDRMEIVLRH